ncbi:IclR family transcriptional regulator [Altererythrobacter sp.]|uniref:IclR family transcriptional regulator n=1 Tax=Altererythrobacter sp. TaxID=1872480 RepID=UPI003D140DEC
MSDSPRGSALRLIFLLKTIASGPHHFLLAELAESTKLPKSTLHRLLQNLVQTGLVERGRGQSYRPGRELYLLASQLVSRFDLARSAQPFLHALVEKWQETAVVCAYSPADHLATILRTVQTDHPLRFAVEQGSRFELAWGALGRSMLAFLSSGEVEAILREVKTGPLSGKPRPRREEMQDILEEIRRDGYARYFDGGFDIAGVAAPIFGADDEVLGCIGMTMPSSRFQPDLEDEQARSVREAASKLSEMARICYS